MRLYPVSLVIRFCALWLSVEWETYANHSVKARTFCSSACSHMRSTPPALPDRDVWLFSASTLKMSPKFKLRNYRFFLVFFYEISQPLNFFIYTNVQLEKVLRFAIEEAWISKILAGKALTWVENVTDVLRFCYLNIFSLRINISLIFMSSSSDEFTRL